MDRNSLYAKSYCIRKEAPNNLSFRQIENSSCTKCLGLVSSFSPFDWTPGKSITLAFSSTSSVLFRDWPFGSNLEYCRNECWFYVAYCCLLSLKHLLSSLSLWSVIEKEVLSPEAAHSSWKYSMRLILRGDKTKCSGAQVINELVWNTNVFKVCGFKLVSHCRFESILQKQKSELCSSHRCGPKCPSTTPWVNWLSNYLIDVKLQIVSPNVLSAYGNWFMVLIRFWLLNI